MLGIPDCIANCTRSVIPQPTEWQHVGHQINAGLIFAGANFVNIEARKPIKFDDAMRKAMRVPPPPIGKKAKGEPKQQRRRKKK